VAAATDASGKDNNVHVLGIETSCDETAAAVLRCRNGACRILSEQLASQSSIHARFGGVVPEIASREHVRLLPPMVDAVMEEAGLEWEALEAIAVTAGPGLMGALLVGVSYARAAGLVQGLKVLPIHHMEGHLFAAGLSGAMPAFPFLTLLVSGGHTLLIRTDGVGRYSLLGQTVDDAAGECFDKCARLLGLPYPGGPAIAGLAAKGDPSRFALPRPMLHAGGLNFSFSGLKTAVLYRLRELGEPDAGTRADLAAGIEAAICEVLVAKALRACREQRIPRLTVAGGVAANARLRELLRRGAAKEGIALSLPEGRYCTDNAAMIAYAGILRLQHGLEAPQTWDARPRWPLAVPA
jgi:putative glycoprotease GCP